MARPLSDDRRTALLAAATAVFAEHGLAAPTALISKTAGVSEGSLFTYFKTKDELVLALYRELRLSLAARVLADFPTRAGVKQRLSHVFTRYVSWGADDPTRKRALRAVTLAKVITPEVRNDGVFAPVDQLQADAVAQKLLHLPPELVAGTIKALAEMTMDLIERFPSRRAAFLEAGAQMLWAALSVRP
jgi:AcrR family transcriptional regulator